jgi:hypothetical protein
MMDSTFIDGFTFKHYFPPAESMLNDAELEAVWRIMDEEVGAKRLFYNVECRSFDEFRQFFSLPSDGGCFNPIAFAFMDGLLHGVCWLTHVEGKSARLHFFCTRVAQQTLNTVNVGRAMMKHWARLKVDGEPLLQSLVGITPKSYKLVLKYIQKVGFTVIGEAKGGIHFIHEDKYDDAVISTMELKEEY